MGAQTAASDKVGSSLAMLIGHEGSRGNTRSPSPMKQSQCPKSKNHVKAIYNNMNKITHAATREQQAVTQRLTENNTDVLTRGAAENQLIWASTTRPYIVAVGGAYPCMGLARENKTSLNSFSLCVYLKTRRESFALSGF